MICFGGVDNPVDFFTVSGDLAARIKASFPDLSDEQYRVDSLESNRSELLAVSETLYSFYDLEYALLIRQLVGERDEFEVISKRGFRILTNLRDNSKTIFEI